MKTAALAAALALSSCAHIPLPGLSGYDCDNPPKTKGIASVQKADRLPGYVIVTPVSVQPAQPGPARAWALTQARLSVASSMRSAGVAPRAISLIGGNAYVTVDALPQSAFRALAGNAIIQENAKVSINALPWGIDRSDQRGLPLDGAYTPRATGADSHGFIVDTGIDCTHPALKCGDGWVHPSVGATPEDQHGHGTHVAGTVAGKGLGMSKATVHPVRVLNARGEGSTESVIGGIAWVVQNQVARKSVLNMSLGGSSQPALDQAVCDAVAAGVTVVVAAGNERQPACLASPARASWAFTVAASDRWDKQASFTNNGGCVDIWAPGVDIESAWPGGGTDTLSGTSMASPHVAGAAAGCIEIDPARAALEACILGRATPDKIPDPGGAPNRLLYVGQAP